MNLKIAMKILGVTRKDLAGFLSVTERTINRWIKFPDSITGPSEKAILAWLQLNDLSLNWRPDSMELCIEDDGTIVECKHFDV